MDEWMDGWMDAQSVQGLRLFIAVLRSEDTTGNHLSLDKIIGEGFFQTEPQVIMPRTSGRSATKSLTNESYERVTKQSLAT